MNTWILAILWFAATEHKSNLLRNSSDQIGTSTEKERIRFDHQVRGSVEDIS